MDQTIGDMMWAVWTPPLLNDLFREYTNQSIGWLSYFMDGVNQPVYADYFNHFPKR